MQRMRHPWTFKGQTPVGTQWMGLSHLGMSLALAHHMDKVTLHPVQTPVLVM